MPLVLVYHFVGVELALVASAALFRREQTQEGQRIDVPMFESMALVVLGEHLAGQAFDPPVGAAGKAEACPRAGGLTRRRTDGSAR